jgi:hypothetical protein
MKTNNFAGLMLFIVALSMPSLAEAAPAKGCPIASSVYRDGDDKGFELVFDAPPPNTPYYATAVIHHSQHRSLYRFTVNQSSGYGSVWLNEISKSNSNQNKSFWITFFNQDLKSATPLWLGEEKEAPEYAVIAQLGSHDYYRRRGTANPPLIGDVLWIFDRCQAQPSNAVSKINSGKYWIGGVGMSLFVKGNQYYYADENGQTEWRPISRLKYVKDGVIFGEGYYWCQSTLPGLRGMCTPLGWANPMSDQELSCNQALITAHSTLLNVKNLNSLHLTPTKVSAYYPDNPTGRPDGYKFFVNGSGGYDVLASSKLMERVSSAIITTCPNISMVTFSAKPEGEVTYGLVNNKVQEFDCYKAYDIGLSSNPRPLWGYAACYP